MKRLCILGLFLCPFLFSTVQAKEIQAEAELINQKGEKIGKAVFVETNAGVLIMLEASGLPPKSEMALHIHELGKCDPPDFMSAKGHFNPFKKKHGLLNPEGWHAGDMPNIFTDEKGNVKVHVLNTFITLKGGKENSLLKEGGTSIMIHHHKDDYLTDPAGNAGPRIACGVIRLAR
ncbi:MAG: superoxide dismutase family protein [Aquificaceae bacterium]|nr:superoxide dismutase family protein [Aquificaceae bacterium]